MKGLVMLPAGATDAAEKVAHVAQTAERTWGAPLNFELEDTKTAWESLLHVTGGKFPAYFAEVTRGTDSEQWPLYSCGFVVDFVIGKGTADLIVKMLEVSKPVYYARADGVLIQVRGIHKVKHDMRRGWRILYDDQPDDELTEAAAAG